MTAGSEASRGEDEQFARFGRQLVDAIDTAVGPWVERSIRVTAERRSGPGAVTDALVADARAAAEAARADVVPALRSLVETDAEAQRVNPLQVLREAARHCTDVLAAHGVPAVDRDRLQQAVLPSDLYDLAPATWSDIDPSLVDPGIRWSAAKAHVVLSRRRSRP